MEIQKQLHIIVFKNAALVLKNCFVISLLNFIETLLAKNAVDLNILNYILHDDCIGREEVP